MIEPTCGNCKHAIIINDHLLCDVGGLPVEENDRFSCFTPIDSKVDNAYMVRLAIEDTIAKGKGA